MNTVLETLFQTMDLPSLESLVGDGKTQLEREYEIYGKIVDLEDLVEGAAEVEHQQQWGSPLGDGGTIRVRATTVGEKTTYILTLKVKTKEGNQENEIEITDEFFELFRSTIPFGLCKSRYKYPVKGTDLVLEVDVFNDLDCKPKTDYVKIDLEIPEDMEISQIKLPFQLTDARVIKPGKKSEEDLDFVRGLFKKHFELPNPIHQVDK